MASTSIEWTEHSINPIRARHIATGKVGHYCEKIASGCTNCYSSRMQPRFGVPEFGSGQKRGEFDLFLDERKLAEVRRRRKPTRYFWCSMTDFFGDWMQDDWLSRCFEAMDATPQHTHILLTKRPENMWRMWPRKTVATGVTQFRPSGIVYVYKPGRRNVWLIFSASTQADLKAGLPHLLKCHDLAPVLGLSLEPLLERITIPAEALRQLSWCVGGGESGPRARPCHVDWLRSLRDQCREADVAYFCKQLGSNIECGATEVQVDVDKWAAYPEVMTTDPKGGCMADWPEDMRVRQIPTVTS